MSVAIVRSPPLDAEIVRDTSPRRADRTRDDEAERAVLGVVLLDEGDAARVWQRVSAVIDESLFGDPRNATIWRAMTAVRAHGEALDVVTVGRELSAMHRDNAVSAQYLGELTETFPLVAHCETYARLVESAAVRRRLYEIAQRLAGYACDASRSPESVRDKAIEALRGVRIGRPAASSALDLVDSVWDHLTEARAGRKPRPIRLGLPTLDRVTGGGLTPGTCTFLASRPGIGKTTIVSQVAASVAADGRRVLFVALEPSRLGVMQSILSARAGVDLARLTRATESLSQLDVDALTVASNAAAGWPLHVIDASGPSAPDTVARVEAAMRALPTMPELVIVDHLLKVSPIGRHEKSHHGTAEVVSALVSIGKRTGAAMLVLAHTGRGVSTPSGLFRRPRAEDLAGGDAINRDADGIILLHSPHKYPTTKEDVGDETKRGLVEILVPKFRGVEDGAYGCVRFRGEVQRFEEIVRPNDSGTDEYGDPSHSHSDFE